MIDRTKIMQWVIGLLMFCCIFEIYGIKGSREAQQMIFMLACISLFALILNNIWVTLFVLWTVFLYSFFKFQGGNYLSNVFFGAVLYKMTKISFNKDNIKFFNEFFLWFVFLNVSYAALQVSGYDFIYSISDEFNHPFGIYEINTQPNGFMVHKSIMATLVALGIPILAARGNRMAWTAAIGLFVPLYLCKTSLCLFAGFIGLLFVMYYRLPKVLTIATALICILFGSFYVNKIDKIGIERFGQWRITLKHYIMHPLTGWGLDSFANITKDKDFRIMNAENIIWSQKLNKKIRVFELWDNPHNLIVSLLFEFGILGLIFAGGYFIQNFFKFNKAIKNSVTIGLAGFVVVFLLISMGHFPIFLARISAFCIPMFALFEVSIS